MNRIARIIEFHYPSSTECWVKAHGYEKRAEIHTQTYRPDETPSRFLSPFVIVMTDGTAYANADWGTVFPSASAYARNRSFLLRRGSRHGMWHLTYDRMVGMLEDTGREPRRKVEEWVQDRNASLLWALNNEVHLLLNDPPEVP